MSCSVKNSIFLKAFIFQYVFYDEANEDDSKKKKKKLRVCQSHIMFIFKKYIAEYKKAGSVSLFQKV